MASYDHDAVRKAYPNAVYIDDNKGIFDANGIPVVINQSNVDAARVELNKLNYKMDRLNPENGYPSLGSQLDQLYHDMKNGKLNTSGEWYVGISSVKAKYPKPS
jgi:hypothetical protein|tara:strand:+ start:285 stop:596 length:312 start_codon:yes stop_codon:yes gene_type:complete